MLKLYKSSCLWILFYFLRQSRRHGFYAAKPQHKSSRGATKNAYEWYVNQHVSPVKTDTCQLDMQMMVRMSEAISMDMSLEQLLDTMMKMIIENSGAQKGIFLLSELNGELLLVAEGDLDSMQVSFWMSSNMWSCVMMYLFTVFVLRQNRKGVFLCGKAACTNIVAAVQRKNVEINTFRCNNCRIVSKTSLLYIWRQSDRAVFLCGKAACTKALRQSRNKIIFYMNVFWNEKNASKN